MTIMNRVLQIITLSAAVAGCAAVATPGSSLAAASETPASCSDSIDHIAARITEFGLSVVSQSDTALEASGTVVDLTATCADEAVRLVVESDDTEVALTYEVNARRTFSAFMNAEFSALGGVVKRQLLFAEVKLSARFDAHTATGQSAAVGFERVGREFSIVDVDGAPQAINDQLLEIRDDPAWRLAHRVMLGVSRVGDALPVIVDVDVEGEVLDWLTMPLPDGDWTSVRGALACSTAALVCSSSRLVPGCQFATRGCIETNTVCSSATRSHWEPTPERAE